MKLDTPIGKISVPDNMAKPYENKTDIELLEILLEQNKGHLDPVLVQILVDKGLLHKGETEKDLRAKLSKMQEDINRAYKLYDPWNNRKQDIVKQEPKFKTFEDIEKDLKEDKTDMINISILQQLSNVKDFGIKTLFDRLYKRIGFNTFDGFWLSSQKVLEEISIVKQLVKKIKETL